jgi:hypothetical protein
MIFSIEIELAIKNPIDLSKIPETCTKQPPFLEHLFINSLNFAFGIYHISNLT